MGNEIYKDAAPTALKLAVTAIQKHLFHSNVIHIEKAPK